MSTKALPANHLRFGTRKAGTQLVTRAGVSRDAGIEYRGQGARAMTHPTGATREQTIRLIREMMETVKPKDLTDDEAAAMVEILKAAQDRKQAPIRAGVVYLDLVRSRPHARR
jgi:hypothetical protein